MTGGRELLAEQQRTSGLVDEAVRAVARREKVIIAGDRHSGYVGVLVAPVYDLTPETVNFLITHGRGQIYAMLEAGRLDALGLELMRPREATQRPAMRVPVDHVASTTTGLSAADRTATIRALADPASSGDDFRVPGHVFPIGARPGGVLERPGHTEAAVDLMHMAGLPPAVVACSILADDGTTAGPAEIRDFATEHGMTVIRIADIAGYRREQEDVIERVGECVLPIPEGRFLAVGYRDRFEPGEHVALVHGDFHDPGPVMVRVHAECLAGDVFGIHVCECRAHLKSSIDEIVEHGCGVLLYVRPPGGEPARFRHIEHAADQTHAAEDANALEAAVNGVALSVLRDLGITADRLVSEPSARHGD